MKMTIEKQQIEELPMQITEASMGLTAAVFGVPLHYVKNFVEEYEKKFRAGPETFIPWYQHQRKLHGEGKLAFEPYYPHEIFPDLRDEGYSWFYDHPAWANGAGT